MKKMAKDNLKSSSLGIEKVPIHHNGYSHISESSLRQWARQPRPQTATGMLSLHLALPLGAGGRVDGGQA